MDLPNNLAIPPPAPAEAHGFPVVKFFGTVAGILAGTLCLFRLLAPAVFRNEIARPIPLLEWTFGMGIPLSLFEYLYHRYLLHSAVFPFMAAMHRAHGTHHSLTSVKAAVSPNEPAQLVEVHSEFPVDRADQEDSMMFPLFSLPIFIGVFFILLGLPLKLIFPQQPVLLSLLLAVALYYVLYEVWHAILHLPYDRFWRPMMEARASRRLFRRLYGFHLMHHWRPTSNLAIVGFWGMALWDHSFRTHRRPNRLPLQGQEVSYEDARLAKPLWPIATLDRWQAGLYKGSRTLERYLAKVFLHR